MVEKHGKYFLETWQQFCTFHCRLCGVEVTCEEREHRTNCTLKSLRWWSAANEQHNKEINNGVNMYKQEDVGGLVACDVKRKIFEMKEEEHFKVEQVENVGKKVQALNWGMQALQWEQRSSAEQLKEGNVGELHSGLKLNRGEESLKEQKKEQIMEKQMRDKACSGIDAQERREEANQGELGEQLNMWDKTALGNAKNEEPWNQGTSKKKDKLKQEREQRGERCNSDEEDEEEEVGFLVMADCIDHYDEGAPAKAWSKTSANRQRSSKKPVSKLIKSVIDIDDDDEGSRTHHSQEDSDLLVDIKTVRVKRVIRMTSTTTKKAQPLVAGNNKENMVDSPGLPPVGQVTGSGDDAKRENLQNFTTVTLGIKRFEASLLIGPQGKNIRNLEQKTGAKIGVSGRIGEMQSVEIHGNIACVARARAEVEKYFFSNCKTKVKVSEEVARALYANKGKVLSDIKADYRVRIHGLREGADDVIYMFGSEEGEREAKAKLEEFANSMRVPYRKGMARNEK